MPGPPRFSKPLTPELEAKIRELATSTDALPAGLDWHRESRGLYVAHDGGRRWEVERIGGSNGRKHGRHWIERLVGGPNGLAVLYPNMTEACRAAEKRARYLRSAGYAKGEDGT